MHSTEKVSVADPGCLSRIPDPKTAMKDIGEKNFVVIPFFWSHKFHKIELFYFLNVDEKNLGQLFTQKIVSKLSKIWVWDPGSEFRDPVSGKNLFRIPGPGVKTAPDPGSVSATLEKVNWFRNFCLIISISIISEKSLP
jgi:hypothetical protein